MQAIAYHCSNRFWSCETKSEDEELCLSEHRACASTCHSIVCRAVLSALTHRVPRRVRETSPQHFISHLPKINWSLVDLSSTSHPLTAPKDQTTNHGPENASLPIGLRTLDIRVLVLRFYISITTSAHDHVSYWKPIFVSWHNGTPARNQHPLPSARR